MLAQQSWDSLKLDDVVRFLEDSRTEYAGGSSERVAIPWDLSADVYINFARTDLRATSMRSRVNALGNAKRALHCQVDSVLYCAGFWDHAQSKCWDFRTRMEVIGQMKIATPDVLRNINRLRNEVEHKYLAPTDLHQLRDFIDVVELFVDATGKLASHRYETTEFTRLYRKAERSIGVELRNGVLEARVYGAKRARRLRPRNWAEFKRLQVAVYVANRRAGGYP